MSVPHHPSLRIKELAHETCLRDLGALNMVRFVHVFLLLRISYYAQILQITAIPNDNSVQLIVGLLGTVILHSVCPPSSLSAPAEREADLTEMAPPVPWCVTHIRLGPNELKMTHIVATTLPHRKHTETVRKPALLRVTAYSCPSYMLPFVGHTECNKSP
jgi:hypothetical protein